MEGTAPTPEIGFSTENCASCKGQGIELDQTPCSACKGKGRVLVVKPSTRCPWCRGSGKPESGSLWYVDHCVVCLGTGWVWTEFHVEGHSQTAHQ
jgi:DnaJ-class molecular chaperone